MQTSDLLRTCSNVLAGHGAPASTPERLRRLADALDDDVYPDTYGEGEYLQSFEAEVAAMFGKEAAVFMPSGTMAQQIALRIWSDRSGNRTLAMHPSSHLEFAEYLGYQFLHGLQRVQFGGPEFLANRMLNVSDLESLGCVPSSLLLELPYRELGGQLPDWEDLVAMRDWATAHDVRMHLDGARAWHCAHLYGKSFADLGEIFDSIYVSFYKDLGGMGGCMLLGPGDFIKESRVWQRRHGGNLVNQEALVASARVGLAQNLDQLPLWSARAREVGEVLAGIPGVWINPSPVQVNFFQLYLAGDREALLARHHELAAETGTFLFGGLRDSAIPGIVTTEIHLFARSLEFDIPALHPFVTRLLEAG